MKTFFKNQMNIPNFLSLLRLFMIPAFIVVYFRYTDDIVYLWFAAGILVLSWFTDFLDGFIARKFNQTTEFGKIIDPLADKITQVSVVICLAFTFRPIIPLAICMFLKELLQGIGGLIVVKHGIKMKEAQWFGKISTGCFYASMIFIVAFKNMPQWLFLSLVILVAITMLYSFVQYLLLFVKIFKTNSKS